MKEEKEEEIEKKINEHHEDIVKVDGKKVKM
jgi:hypothetical protein